MIARRAVDPTGFEAWYGMHAVELTGRIAAGVGDSTLGREAAAEAMARAYERWDRVGVMDSPEGWVYRVAVNLCRRGWRRRRLERRALSRLPMVATTTPESSWDAYSGSPVGHESVVHMVDQLPDRMRTAVHLRYWEDLSEREVAERMDIAPGTASAMLAQARRKLHTGMNDTGTGQPGLSPDHAGIAPDLVQRAQEA